MDTIVVLCDPAYFEDVAAKIKEAFSKEAVEVVTVSTHGGLKQALGKRPIGIPPKRVPFSKRASIEKRRAGILYWAGFGRLGADWKYKGFPCAPIYYSDVERGRICADGDCWKLPVRVFRDAIYRQN